MTASVPASMYAGDVSKKGCRSLETPEKDRMVFVTDDARMKDGQLHPRDKDIVDQCDVIMTPLEALETAKREQTVVAQASEHRTPNDAKEVDGFVALTPETMEQLRQMMPNVRAHTRITAHGLIETEQEAQLIRKLRVDERYTWRMVAYTTHLFYRLKSAKGEQLAVPLWEPPENQLYGMALCDRAAEILGEDYRKEPWN